MDMLAIKIDYEEKDLRNWWLEGVFLGSHSVEAVENLKRKGQP